jgi:predicted ArsR family transcriptional regulator
MTTDRRDLLLKVFPACALMCTRASAAPAKHKFSEKSEMTYEQIYQFAYGGFIRLMKNLAEELGKDRFDALLKKVASRTTAQQAKQQAAKQGRNDLAAFIAPLKSKDSLFAHALTFAFVEDTEKAVEIKVTECLWAKTFRDAGAADIGYAAMCHTDFALAPAFNPKMKMIRTKTLMQGHDCCNHRYVIGA